MTPQQYNSLISYATACLRSKKHDLTVTPSDLVNDAYIKVGAFDLPAIKKAISSQSYDELSRALAHVPYAVAGYGKSKAVIETTKVCTKCRQEKGVNDFYFFRRANTGQTGYQSRCKACMCQVDKNSASYARHKEYNTARWYKIKADPVLYQLHKIRKKARKPYFRTPEQVAKETQKKREHRQHLRLTDPEAYRIKYLKSPLLHKKLTPEQRKKKGEREQKRLNLMKLNNPEAYADYLRRKREERARLREKKGIKKCILKGDAPIDFEKIKAQKAESERRLSAKIKADPERLEKRRLYRRTWAKNNRLKLKESQTQPTVAPIRPVKILLVRTKSTLTHASLHRADQG